MRQPDEPEWEYAARSRGQLVPWPTNDGNFRPGENVTLAGDRDSSYEEGNPTMGSVPSNPLGLYNLLDGVCEWVTGHPGSDPEGAGIGKGGSDFSSRLFEGVPGRSVHKRLSDSDLAIYTSFLRDELLERHLRKLDPHSPVGSYIGIRCVAAVSAPPAETGFGIAPPDESHLSPQYMP